MINRCDLIVFELFGGGDDIFHDVKRPDVIIVVAQNIVIYGKRFDCRRYRKPTFVDFRFYTQFHRFNSFACSPFVAHSSFDFFTFSNDIYAATAC